MRDKWNLLKKQQGKICHSEECALLYDVFYGIAI